MPQSHLTIADLDTIVLQAGGHDRRTRKALCVMEAVAWFAGKPHSDRPPCVSAPIATFLRSWNDGMNEDDRQILKPLIPKVIDTAAAPEIELRRSWMALDWLCRVSAPAWLRLAGLTVEAAAIEATAPIIDTERARAAQESLNVARSAAYNARTAAWDAARAAAGTAAWAAAGAAAWDAARDAAWDAAGAAAWAAAWDAAGAAARDAAWDAAGAAAWAAAWANLRPTVMQLQQSAIELIECMAALDDESETTP